MGVACMVWHRELPKKMNPSVKLRSNGKLLLLDTEEDGTLLHRNRD
jgi:hypothetical protein